MLGNMTIISSKNPRLSVPGYLFPGVKVSEQWTVLKVNRYLLSGTLFQAWSCGDESHTSISNLVECVLER